MPISTWPTSRSSARSTARSSPATPGRSWRDNGCRVSSPARSSCIGLTEPRGGSDAANLALSARRNGDNYILKGEKSSISMADQADAVVLFARTGAPETARAASAHSSCRWIRRASRRCATTISAARRSAEVRSSSTSVIPAGNRLADEGEGFVQVMQGFDFSRALIGLQVLRFRAGLARRELGLCAGAQGIRRADRRRTRA